MGCDPGQCSQETSPALSLRPWENEVPGIHRGYGTDQQTREDYDGSDSKVGVCVATLSYHEAQASTLDASNAPTVDLFLDTPMNCVRSCESILLYLRNPKDMKTHGGFPK